MINIFETEKLMDFMKALKNDFNSLSKDVAHLEGFYPVIDQVDTWRYSTGPVFNYPPFSSEMAGFDGGRLLKKSYSDIFEARLKGAYSSGFIQENHVVTISPSKPATSPLMAAFFKTAGDKRWVHNIHYHNNRSNPSPKPPTLIGIGCTFDFDERTKAHVGVSAGTAYSITLYYHDAMQRIIAASMVTAPFTFQSEYEMLYDDTGDLKSITSGTVIWERKTKN